MAKTTKPKPAPEPARETLAAEDTNTRVRVRVECGAMGEDGVTYFRGAIFETTPRRAAALGDRAAIPVINADDAKSTLLSFVQTENNISPNVTLFLAALKK